MTTMDKDGMRRFTVNVVENFQEAKTFGVEISEQPGGISPCSEAELWETLTLIDAKIGRIQSFRNALWVSLAAVWIAVLVQAVTVGLETYHAGAEDPKTWIPPVIMIFALVLITLFFEQNPWMRHEKMSRLRSAKKDLLEAWDQWRCTKDFLWQKRREILSEEV